MATVNSKPLKHCHQDEPLLAYYSQRAPYYEQLYALPARQRDMRALEAYLAKRFQGRDVLEVACGTGYWTRCIADSARRVHATDQAPEPLAIARAKESLRSVSFSEADAFDLPDRLGSFDAAFAGFWFSHVPIARRGQFLASLHRRLSVGSLVVWLDNTCAQQELFPISERDADGNTYQTRTLIDGSSHRVLKNFPSAGEVADLVAPLAAVSIYQEMEHFWLLEYEFHPAQGRQALNHTAPQSSRPRQAGHESAVLRGASA